jgi:gliding motility-associated-like protein
VRKIFFILLFLFTLTTARATHNRAGEITFKHVGASNSLQYEITITTYTRLASIQADRPFIDSVHLGDGTTAIFRRILFEDDPLHDIRHNVYKIDNATQTYTYLSSGTYDIYFIDPNRNEGVVNIPNSVNTPFAIHTTLHISGNISPPDNSPILTYKPIDRACIGVPFYHNPGAYDPDGDSLSFALVSCRGDGNLAIPGYFQPAAANLFSLDPVTGQLTWDSPPFGGIYTFPPTHPDYYEVNVAFEVKEWRIIGGIYRLIGVVERDMQISVYNCNNRPPQIQNVVDTCVLANSSISFDVTATDPDGHMVYLSASGAPLDQVSAPQATFTTNPSLPYSSDTVIGTFSWSPACAHVRQQPYQVLLKAKDTLAAVDFISLVNLKSFFITVIGPAPTNLSVTPSGNSMILHWDPDVCPQVTGYKIYHRTGVYAGTIECPCQTGVPSYTGYSLIGTTTGLNNTTFTDNNNGQGLTIGVLHCYLVVAVFRDGSESCASNQACEHLKKDLPVITNVSVDTTNGFENPPALGAMYIAWSKPNELDTVQFPGPYEYRLYHSPDFNAGSPAFVTSLPSVDFSGLNDTIYYDENLNTDVNKYSYYVELWYNNAGTPTLKGKSSNASSIFLTLTPTDEKIILSWEEHVPWSNYRYIIYRLNTITNSYDSIGQVNSPSNGSVRTYSDTGLVNGITYCYYVKSVGTYNTPGILDTLFNSSQKACATAYDNVPPCPPQLTVNSFCTDGENVLSWTNPNHSCADDVIKYYIYFSPDSNTFERIDSVLNSDSTTYYHQNLEDLSGCYKVTALDSNNNESAAITVCVDTCRQYVLPSVFTPNGDGLNDLFHPCDSTTSEQLQKKNCPPYKNVKDINIKIYDRWGLLVFQTTDKNVNWDGKNYKSKGDCPDGVYYYVCKVNFKRVVGTESVELKGYVHLLRGGE